LFSFRSLASRKAHKTGPTSRWPSVG